MKVLVTGASGMLGSNIIQELLQQNHEVIGLVLPHDVPAHLKKFDIELYSGNILDCQSLAPMVNRVDAIIHGAAITDIWPERASYIRDVNILGTKHLISTARHLQRFVHIGSANSFGAGPGNVLGNESRPYTAGKFGTDYMDSKYEAQQLVLDAYRKKGLPAIVLNPTFMFGPYDSKPGAGEMILSIAKGKIPGFSNGGKNYIAAKDVAKAAVNVLTMGRLGECYITGHENLTFEEAFQKIAKVIKVKPPRLPLPNPLVHSYGWIGSLWSRWTKQRPTVTYPMARISTDFFYYDSSKAIQELHLPQTPIEVAIRECWEWMRRGG